MSEGKTRPSEPPPGNDLRRQAEERVRQKKAKSTEPVAETDVRALVHELQARQIELEMQNEELRRAQAAAQELSDKYCDLLERVDVGITQIDLDYNIVSANRKQAEIVGRSVDELLGKKCYREYEGRENVCPHCPGVKAVASGVPADIEATGQRRDGTAFAVHVTASPISDRSGRTTGFIEVVEDIRERKRREEEIVWLARFPGDNPNPVLRVGNDGAILYCNRAGLSLLATWGCHEGGFLPSPWREIAIDALNSDSVQQAECQCGQQVFALTFAPIVESAYVNVYALDITERKRAEEALRESKERFRCVVETSPDAIALLDLDGRILMASQRTARFFGFDRVDELLSSVTTGFELLAPEDRRRARDNVRKLIDVGLLRDLEYSGCRRDGSRFPAELSASLQRDSRGNPEAMVIVLRDVTERKQAQRLLERAKDAAEAANRAKSEFLANMSHEIRTPMTAILGFSDLLATPNLPCHEQREFLTGIQRNGKVLLELIGDVLDLSQIEADRLTLEMADCSLRQIVDDVLSTVQVRAQEKRLSLKVDYQYPLPEKIRTDPARLRQILVNLLGNAVKFTGQGDVCLTIRCLREAAGPARIQFAVSDAGIGIPADRIGDLFQPFMQVDGSATRRYGGTGLGLVISKRLAEALGGDIEVASELGQGSTFTLTIEPGSLDGVPMLQGPKVVAAADVGPARNGPNPSLRGRLLLAEDDPSIRRIVASFLQKMNLAVTCAENGQMACDMADKSKAEGRPYDVILMDIQMPKMNGYEATQWLRQHGWQGFIVALTAHAMVGDREKCLAAGCDNYIVKPIVLTGLWDALAPYLVGTAVPADQILDRDKTTAKAVEPSGGDPSDDDMAEVFTKGLAERVEIIQNALRERDLQRLAAIAHQLNGTAAVYGFSQLADVARVIYDRATEEGNLEQVRTAVAELVEMCGPLLSPQQADVMPKPLRIC